VRAVCPTKSDTVRQKGIKWGEKNKINGTKKPVKGGGRRVKPKGSSAAKGKEEERKKGR